MPEKKHSTKFAVAVLAAGSSTRFGPGDKLCADFRGAPLGSWACRNLAQLGFARKWVIAARHDHPCAGEWQNSGFAIAVNQDAAKGQSTSVKLAAGLAMAHSCTHLMIALADMPSVPPQHFRKLLSLANSESSVTTFVSASLERRSPPAIFPRDLLGRLAHSQGDAGARDWLDQAIPVECPDEWLRDIDIPSDIEEPPGS